jgi:hypothetical protein
METIGWLLVAVGAIAGATGGLWLLVVAFQESVLWGLGCLFIPIVSLIFVIMHWDEAGKLFLISLAGSIAMVVGAAMTGP